MLVEALVQKTAAASRIRRPSSCFLQQLLSWSRFVASARGPLAYAGFGMHSPAPIGAAKLVTGSTPIVTNLVAKQSIAMHNG